MKNLLLIFLLFTFVAYSQNDIKKCGTTQKLAELWKENPELKAAYYEKRNQIAQLQDYEKGAEVYTIPIVFHVIHEYGSENISDEQIYNQMEILNKDFRKLNSDIVDVVQPFDTVAGDAQIEFKLATIDPFGNCTNGITRHFSHETNVGDANSKFEQWPRGRYLNVWVVNSISSGAAGYSIFPSGVEGGNRFRDGIMILNRYIGDLGTSNPYRSRALTHEIGHYLGLAHPWGSTNDPLMAINCSDDDGIQDTPNTIGWQTCDLTGTTCDTVLDNVQNYMDYSYCSKMFTKGQISYMRNILIQETAQRSNLWTEQNLAISAPETQTCNPKADFFANTLLTCVGEPVNFTDETWSLSSSNVSYEWTFEDGTSGSSTSQSPSVSFNSGGWKDVKLMVNDDGRKDSIIKEDFIYVSFDWPLTTGPHQFDFEGNPNYWVILNPQNNVSEWEVKNGTGRNESTGIFLNMTSPFEDPTLFSPEYFFDNRRGGSEHAFVTPLMDLNYTSSVDVSFDFACATNANLIDDITEELTVYSSIDCGINWQQRTKVTGNDLVNNGSGWGSFSPQDGTIWTTETFAVPSNIAGGKVQFMFVYTGSDMSNNIAIDNINVTGVLGQDELAGAEKIQVYPNPSSLEKGWNVSYNSSFWGDADYKLLDVTGREISTGVLPENQSSMNLKPNSSLNGGIYILSIKKEDKIFQRKLILE